MATPAPPASGQPAAPPVKGRATWGLVFLLVSIVLGVLLGLFYGQAMWMASGGPQRRVDRLDATLQQKEQFAAALDEQADQADEANDLVEAGRLRNEARRLRGHIPTIEAERQSVEKLRDQAQADAAAGRDWLAQFVWKLTSFAGELFLQVLLLLVVPLVVTSMICGITSLGDVRKLGPLGGATILYYLSTTAIAVTIGIALVTIVRPGKQADDTFAYVEERISAKEKQTALDTLLDVVRGRDVDGKKDPGSGMFPQNIFQAAADTNVLALIVFALVFGAAVTTLGAKGRVVIDFFVAANEAVMKMVHAVMICAPVGIFGLVAANIAKNGGGSQFGQELARLGWYVACVLIGLSLHAIVLATLLALFGRRNPLMYTYHMLRALLTAVSTASSSATLPVTMECVEGNNKVSNRSAGFVLPLGATVNMDGTALYEAVAVIFIAQSLGMDLSAGQLLVIFLTATLAAIGAAGIPEAGLVTMVIVLTAVGIPTAGIGTILAIDWFLDRMRTTVNVYGDAVGAGIVDHWFPPAAQKPEN